MAVRGRGVTIDFNADTAKFDQGVRRVDSGLARFSRSAKDVGVTLGKSFAVFGTLAVTGFTAFSRSVLQAQDELAKMSQKLNISVEGLAGLQHAADISGLSFQALQKGLKSVSTQLFDAASGLVESQRNFRALSIEVRNSDGTLKGTEQILIEVADKFANLENSTEKTALAVKLFGKAGLDLIPLLNLGSEGLRELVEEGQRLNPVTAESARQSEIFNDNLTRLQKTAGVVAIDLVNDLLPAFTELSVVFAQAARDSKVLETALGGLLGAQVEGDTVEAQILNLQKRLKGFREDLAIFKDTSGFFGGLRKSFSFDDIALLELEIDKGSKALDFLLRKKKAVDDEIFAAAKSPVSRTGSATVDNDVEGRKQDAIVKKGDEFVRKVQDQANSLGRTRAQTLEYQKSLLTLNETQELLATKAIKRIEIQDLEKAAFETKAKDVAASNKELLDLVTTNDADIQSTRERIEIMNVELATVGESTVARERAVAEIELEIEFRERLNDILNANIGETEREARIKELNTAKALRQNEIILEGQLASQRKASQRGEAIWDGFVFNFQRNVGDQLFAIMNGEFDNVFDAWQKLLTRMIADFVSRQFTDLLFGEGGLASSLFKGLGNSFGSLLGSIFSFSAQGNVFRNGEIQPYANGGLISQPTFFAAGGTLNVAGEAGVEGIFPLARTRDGDLGVKSVDGGGGDNNIINVSFPIGMNIVARTEIAAAMPMIKEEVMKAVVQAKHRRNSIGAEL